MFKIKKSILLLLIFVLSMFCIFSACKKEQASNTKKIVVATDATWPPMEYIDADRNIVGFDIDILKAAGQEGGFEVEFTNQQWDGIFAGLAGGKYDAIISSLTITDERKKTMDFTIPYVTCGQILVVKKENNSVTNLSQLEGKKVGVQGNTTGALEVRKYKKITLKEYDEIGLAVEDLANDRIDAVVCDNPIAADYVLQNQKFKPILKMTGDIFTVEQYGIAVHKGNNAVLELINSGLKKVQEKGIDKELEKKWLK
ncbi:MAG: basic amino acid ABC transporter substrate-binding protein [Spirochaetes bacterium]|nr:basic amino acid ABC transporter substrate-binding protein [Spirochaetota bacterium]